MDKRFQSLITTLPAPSAELARDLRTALMEWVPDCRESYHGGHRTGVATYHLGEQGPLCCSLQARRDEIRIAFPAGSVTGQSAFLFRPDELPDMNHLEAAVGEAVRYLGSYLSRWAG